METIQDDHLDRDRVAETLPCNELPESLRNVLGVVVAHVFEDAVHADLALLPDVVLLKQPREHDKDAAIVHDVPDVDRPV